MSMNQRAGSITPRTIKESFFKPISFLQKDDTTISDESMRIDKIKGVLDPNNDRAAVLDPNTIRRLDRLDAYQKLLEGEEFTKADGSIDRTYSYSEFLKEHEGMGLYVEEEFASSTSQVSRIGIDLSLSQFSTPQRSEIYRKLTEISISTTDALSVNLSATTGASSVHGKDYPHILHPIEVCRIREAIKLLSPAQRCVVTDIFARERDNGDIKFEDDGGVKSPEIHSILLYLHADQKKVLVIDPSNSSFSKHLIYNGDIILGAIGIDMEICAPKRDIQIYTPGAKTGRLLEHRDCTDIAVKLGFALLEHDAKGGVPVVDINGLKNIASITGISNESKFNKPAFYGKDQCVRICQATEAEAREKGQQFVKGFYRLYDAVLKFYKLPKDAVPAHKIQEDAARLLSLTHDDHDMYRGDLERLQEEYDKALKVVGDVALEL